MRPCRIGYELRYPCAFLLLKDRERVGSTRGRGPLPVPRSGQLCPRCFPNLDAFSESAVLAGLVLLCVLKTGSHCPSSSDVRESEVGISHSSPVDGPVPTRFCTVGGRCLVHSAFRLVGEVSQVTGYDSCDGPAGLNCAHRQATACLCVRVRGLSRDRLGCEGPVGQHCCMSRRAVCRRWLSRISSAARSDPTGRSIPSGIAE